MAAIELFLYLIFFTAGASAAPPTKDDRAWAKHDFTCNTEHISARSVIQALDEGCKLLKEARTVDVEFYGLLNQGFPHRVGYEGDYQFPSIGAEEQHFFFSYPLIEGGAYKGGGNPGPHRVIFYDAGDRCKFECATSVVNVDNNPTWVFCRHTWNNYGID